MNLSGKLRFLHSEQVGLPNSTAKHQLCGPRHVGDLKTPVLIPSSSWFSPLPLSSPFSLCMFCLFLISHDRVSGIALAVLQFIL